jgi:hypothetical protein
MRAHLRLRSAHRQHRTRGLSHDTIGGRSDLTGGLAFVVHNRRHAPAHPAAGRSRALADVDAAAEHVANGADEPVDRFLTNDAAAVADVPEGALRDSAYQFS